MGTNDRSLVESAPPGRICVPECLTGGARGWAGPGLGCGQSGTAGFFFYRLGRAAGDTLQTLRVCLSHGETSWPKHFPQTEPMPSRATAETRNVRIRT